MSNFRYINGKPLSGLIAATFTPLNKDGTVHLEKVPAIVEHLLNYSISGLYVLGSTGEGLSLTFDERCDVAEEFVKASAGRIPVIVQVGSESLAQAKLLAERAQMSGADAISAVSPVYFKPESVETLVDSMSEIARGAPELPFYYYHVPAATGVDHRMLDFLRVGASKIPNLAGIKYTSPDVEEYSACVEFSGDDFQIMWGVDEKLFDGLQVGARAAVGSTYNFMVTVYQRLLMAFANGDFAEALNQQRFAQLIVDIFVPFGQRVAQKAIMNMIGPDCGPCRLPLRTLTSIQTAALHEDLLKVGFFEYLENPSDRITV